MTEQHADDFACPGCGAIFKRVLDAATHGMDYLPRMTCLVCDQLNGIILKSAQRQLNLGG